VNGNKHRKAQVGRCAQHGMMAFCSSDKLCRPQVQAPRRGQAVGILSKGVKEVVPLPGLG
jgi:hypothetical protein